MNILFLTLVRITSIQARGIYTDLMRQFIREGHHVTVVSPVERRNGIPTHLKRESGCTLLYVKTLNIVKANIVEKGVGTLALEYQYEAAIRQYLHDVRFDLVLYSTPPITFARAVSFIRKRDQAQSYLLLKDIFPQNAVDIGMMRKNGLLYRYFRRKEKILYGLSDYIGCMSPANVEYLLTHNTYIDRNKVEVCPNSVELSPSAGVVERPRKKVMHDIPADAVVFIYGGSLGKPQGLDFLLEVLASNQNKSDRYFLIVGSGTGYDQVGSWFTENVPSNAQLKAAMPKEEYDELVQSCDVGMIFLDRRFTIPNYPSRLLTYLEYKMPVIMATDTNTDIGMIAEMNGYGRWCESGDLEKFNAIMDNLCAKPELRKKMGEMGFRFLEKNYTVEKSYEVIIKSVVLPDHVSQDN